MFILQMTVPGAACSWEEQLRGLTAGRQNKVFTKGNTIQCLCKMLINPNLMLKKKDKLNLQTLRAHIDALGRFLKVDVKMEVILKPEKDRTHPGLSEGRVAHAAVHGL